MKDLPFNAKTFFLLHGSILMWRHYFRRKRTNVILSLNFWPSLDENSFKVVVEIFYGEHETCFPWNVSLGELQGWLSNGHGLRFDYLIWIWAHDCIKLQVTPLQGDLSPYLCQFRGEQSFHCTLKFWKIKLKCTFSK